MQCLAARHAGLLVRRYVLSTDARLLRLKPYAQSPVTWFRNPYAYLVLVRFGTVSQMPQTDATFPHRSLDSA